MANIVGAPPELFAEFCSHFIIAPDSPTLQAGGWLDARLSRTRVEPGQTAKGSQQPGYP
jgi:hypothetical protein